MAEDGSSWIIRKIPFLNCILRKIKANREPIERTLKTKKETEWDVEERHFLGIFKISSGKRFNILNLKKKK